MAMNVYSDNINIVTPQSFSQGLQQRVDRLQKDANRLFSLGNIRKHCQMALMRFLANQQPSPYADWGMQLSHDREFRFAQSLTQSYTSTKEEIIQWARGCMSDYLLQEVMEERSKRIEEFSRMKIASRWYQMKDDDKTWRVFAQNIPFGMAGREEEVKEFFELLDRICILTDILTGHAAEYGLEVDYTKMPKDTTGKNNAKPKQKKPAKSRETMTFKRNGRLTEGHLTLLFSKLVKDGWIEGEECNFKVLFSGNRDEDCELTWLGRYGKGTLVELFRQMINEDLITLANGFTLSAVLEGHFKDKNDQWMTGLDKGNKPNERAKPIIQECLKLMKADPQQALYGDWQDNEDFASEYDPYDHQDMQLHKR